MPEMDSIAHVFPGQGSQYVGMGLDVYSSYAAARGVFDEADAALGFPLSQLCFEGPEEELTKTSNAQPAVLVTSIAYLRVIQQTGNNLASPKFVAGHSLGEYSALVAADVLGLTDAVRLVRERGRLMYEAGQKNPGGMLAIMGVDKGEVEEICSHSKTEISNMNCPGQIVISGSIDALAEASKLAKMKGIRHVVPLKVSGAFHSTLMEPIMDEFTEVVSSFVFHPAKTPIIANVTAEPIIRVESIKEELLRQLSHCVQWQQSVEYMTLNGVTTFCEIGPGKVLTGLIKRISPQAETINVSSAGDLAQLEKMKISNQP